MICNTDKVHGFYLYSYSGAPQPLLLDGSVKCNILLSEYVLEIIDIKWILLSFLSGSFVSKKWQVSKGILGRLKELQACLTKSDEIIRDQVRNLNFNYRLSPLYFTALYFTYNHT